MQRRESLRRIAALAALPVFAGWKSYESTMSTRAIPSTGEKLPVIGVGTWETFDMPEESGEYDHLRGVLSTLVEKGGKVVDTSPMYGFAEKVVGMLSQQLGINDKLFVATKVWTEGKERGIEQMENSFSLLKRNTIDLMQVHNLVDWRTHIKTLRKWKEEGKVRYIGITHYQPSAYAEMEKIISMEPLDFMQINYNVQDRKSADRLIPFAAEKKIAVIISQPFGTGKLFERAASIPLPSWAGDVGATAWSQLFLKFVITNPGVTTVIPGTGRPDHMLENVMAGYGSTLSEKQRAELIRLFK